MLETIDWVEGLGWIAASLTLSAYAMRTMLPLRGVAIVANVFFILYSAFSGIVPTLVLHAILLPFNSYRMYEILRTTRQMQSLNADSKAFEWLQPLLKPVRVEDGEFLFRKGDRPDCLYIMRSGTILLEEIDVKLQGEQIFGEIAFFTDERERTVSAKCLGQCEIMTVDEVAFMRLYNQNPAFGLYMVKLTASRLLDGMQRNPEVYRKPSLLVPEMELEKTPVPAGRGGKVQKAARAANAVIKKI